MIGDKELMILDMCNSKEVLDIGCVELLGNYTKDNLKNTQHYKISEVSKRAVGIDLEEEGVEGLNSIGCDCHVSYAEDVHQLELGKFDIVLLGDIIEHIPDPSTFLINIRNLLKPTGKLICTTPNALAYSNTLFVLLNKTITRKQHVSWFCRVTLENLFKLSGYKLHEMHFCNFSRTASNPIRKYMDIYLCKLRSEFSPLLFGVFELSDDLKTRELQQMRIFQ
jgi:SAM-dependent methyltransferase